MPRVMCEWSTCKYNDCKYANQGSGECTKEDIVLGHKSIEDKDGDYIDSMLDCKSYVNDKSKEFK